LIFKKLDLVLVLFILVLLDPLKLTFFRPKTNVPDVMQY
jgi:hypothetical protein